MTFVRPTSYYLFVPRMSTAHHSTHHIVICLERYSSPFFLKASIFTRSATCTRIAVQETPLPLQGVRYDGVKARHSRCYILRADLAGPRIHAYQDIPQSTMRVQPLSNLICSEMPLQVQFGGWRAGSRLDPFARVKGCREFLASALGDRQRNAASASRPLLAIGFVLIYLAFVQQKPHARPRAKSLGTSLAPVAAVQGVRLMAVLSRYVQS
jgi:hypothetical protein